MPLSHYLTNGKEHYQNLKISRQLLPNKILVHTPNKVQTAMVIHTAKQWVQAIHL